MIDRCRVLAMPLLLLLSACGGGSADEADAAPSEVLEGTISDAMLPVDRTRSEAPLEDPEAFQEAQADAEAEEGAVESADNDNAGDDSQAAEAEDGAFDEMEAGDTAPEADE